MGTVACPGNFSMRMRVSNRPQRFISAVSASSGVVSKPYPKASQLRRLLLYKNKQILHLALFSPSNLQQPNNTKVLGTPA
jgi:hypothetical protein